MSSPSSETEGPQPPVPKYTYTVTLTGNSHEEIEGELLSLTRGGYLLDSDYHKRDEFKVYGGRKTTELKHTNPEMTPERYDHELDEWWEKRKEFRKKRESDESE